MRRCAIDKKLTPWLYGLIGVAGIPLYIILGLIIYLGVIFLADNEIIWGSHEWTMLFFGLILPGYVGLGLLVAGLIVIAIISNLRKK